MADSSQPLAPSPVRETVTAVRPALQHVTINEDGVTALVEDLVDASFTLPPWDFPCHISSDAPRTDVIDYFFVANTLNFAFRDFDTGARYATRYNGHTHEGASGLMAALTRAYEAGTPILDGEYLATLTRDNVHDLFDPLPDAAIPLLDARHRILNRVGRRLDERYDGRFHKFVDDASPRLYADGDGLIDRLVQEFPSYGDSNTLVTSTGHRSVQFYKRAQLAVAMTCGRFPDFTVEDSGAFTLFADYHMPNILRSYGALTYDAVLAEKVADGYVFDGGERMEVELRAATVAAADDVLRKLNARRDDDALITGAHLDAALFQQRERVETPVHRALTTAY